MNFKARPAIIFPLILLSALALVTLWINNIVQPAIPKIDGSSRHDPDYIVNNFVTTQTDVNGALRYKLAATEMKHFPDDDTAVLTRPRYTQFAVNKPYTEALSQRGLVSSDGEEVELFEHVKITRQAFAGKGEMTLETDYLNVRPNEELARTASPVIIRQAPKTVIYATGMLFDKKQQTLTLLHKVRAHYERPVSASKTPVNANKSSSKADADKKSGRSPQAEAKNVSKSNTKLKNSNPTKTNDARIRRRYE